MTDSSDDMSAATDVFLAQLEDTSERLSSVMSLCMAGRDTADAGYRTALEAAAKELDAAAAAIRRELASGGGSAA